MMHPHLARRPLRAAPGFRIEPETLALLKRDLPLMKTVGGYRLRHELELVLKEKEPEKCLLRADELGV